MLVRLLDTPARPALTLARVTVAVVMFPHGAPHALGWFGGYGFGGTLGWMTGTLGFPAPLAALAIATELIAPVALLLGVGSRFAALGIVGIMAGAAMTHLPNGFFMNWFGTLPAGTEGFEYHIVMLALSAVVAVEGGGALSLDRLVTRRTQRTSARLVRGVPASRSARAA